MSCRDAWIDMLRATRCSGVRVELPSPAQIPQSSHPYLYFRNTFKDCRLLLKQLWLAFGLVKVPGHAWWWRALILKSSCAREKFNLHLVTFPFCCKGMGRYIYIYVCVYICIRMQGPTKVSHVWLPICKHESNLERCSTIHGHFPEAQLDRQTMIFKNSLGDLHDASVCRYRYPMKKRSCS